MRTALYALLPALLLAGCATAPAPGQRYVYADGSYYAPAHGSHGDYYVGRRVEPVYSSYSVYYGAPWSLHYGYPYYYGPYRSSFSFGWSVYSPHYYGSFRYSPYHYYGPGYWGGLGWHYYQPRRHPGHRDRDRRRDGGLVGGVIRNEYDRRDADTTPTADTLRRERHEAWRARGEAVDGRGYRGGVVTRGDAPRQDGRPRPAIDADTAEPRRRWDDRGHADTAPRERWQVEREARRRVDAEGGGGQLRPTRPGQPDGGWQRGGRTQDETLRTPRTEPAARTPEQHGPRQGGPGQWQQRVSPEAQHRVGPRMAPRFDAPARAVGGESPRATPPAMRQAAPRQIMAPAPAAEPRSAMPARPIHAPQRAVPRDTRDRTSPHDRNRDQEP